MKLKFKGEAYDMIVKVQKQIVAAGGNLSGSDAKGSFSVKGVKGTYSISGDIAEIQITDKPFLVSTAYVEEKIQEFFSK